MSALETRAVNHAFRRRKMTRSVTSTRHRAQGSEELTVDGGNHLEIAFSRCHLWHFEHTSGKRLFDPVVGMIDLLG
jgi:hypothetical protein